MPIAAAPGPSLSLPSSRLARYVIAADGAAHDLSQKRERRVVALLLTVWIINLFDLGFTLIAREQRLLTELNPLAVHVIGHGVVAIVLYKLLLLIIGTAILWHQRRRRVCELILWGYAILCLGLAVHWHNIYRDARPEWMEASILEELAPLNAMVFADSVVRKDLRSDAGAEAYRTNRAPADQPFEDLKAAHQDHGDHANPTPEPQRPAENGQDHANREKK